MAPTVGVEGLRILAWLLAAAALGAVVLSVAAVMGGPADDVPRGDAPTLAAWPLLGWSVAAIVCGTGALLLWTLLPDPVDVDEALDGLE